MAVEHSAGDLARVVALLGAAVVAVPLFRKLGLGSVLGYLAAGLAIGPFGFALFADPAAILHVAELGVVMFLFIIGLEMRPSHLWHLRGQIFGLGALQVGLATAVMTGLGLAFGFPWQVAFVGAAGFVLTSTAIVMQLLGERGDIALPPGQKMVSVLLFEDLLIVPLLAIVAFLAPAWSHAEEGSRWVSVLVGVGSLVGLVVVGLWALNPLFRVLAAAKAREVMTAAALLVVLGSALLMDLGGLSMAMGAFLAGVLLSESAFRHQLEADIEPFRGLLLGLFFLAVGMSLDLALVATNWQLIAVAVPVLMLAKGLCIYAVARFTHSPHGEALDRAVLMAQGRRICVRAVRGGIFRGPDRRQGQRQPHRGDRAVHGAHAAGGVAGAAVRAAQGACHGRRGSGRWPRGQRAGDRLRPLRPGGQPGAAGARLDVLHASGAGKARVVAVCVDDRAAASRIAELARSAFPQAKVLVRSFDRQHALQLARIGVDFQVRETFESALKFGGAALRGLGVDDIEAENTMDEVRRLDGERFALELAAGNTRAGADLMHNNTREPRMRQTPLRPPQREGQVLNEEELPPEGE